MKGWRSPGSSRGNGVGRRGDIGVPTSTDGSKPVSMVDVGLKKQRYDDIDAGQNL